jgi:hypothetical protein
MSISDMSATEVVVIATLIGALCAGATAFLMRRNGRTPRLRARRIEGFHVRSLTPADRARFQQSWREVEARLVDSPAGAVSAADRLLCDVMATRGYPLGGSEQQDAGMAVDHPLILKSYRIAHEIALQQIRGEAGPEELRQAMVHYRALFEELVNQPEMPMAKVSA